MDHKTSIKSVQRSADLKIFVRNVRDLQGKKRSISVRQWATVKDVKDILQQLIHVPANAQRLYFGPLLTSGKELPNHRTLYDAGIDCSGKTILLDLKDVRLSVHDNEYSILSLRYPNDICISSSMYDMTPKALRSLAQHARNGLALGLKPNLALEGSGGTYFMHDSRKNPIAVFKPADEEPYADNNPRGYIRHQPGDSLRKGIVPGEACIREVAAFLLDHDKFAGVPMTTLVEARHPAFNTNGSRLSLAQGGASVGSHSVHLSPGRNFQSTSDIMRKPGSFQEFVKCEFSMDDISPSKISVDEVHKIAILDIRIMNADRNAANLVVRRNPDNTLSLVPIDHGYCLRSVCDVSWMDWCWLDWPQLKQVR
jgi:phosphatidylinositol 4-kinase type 2